MGRPEKPLNALKSPIAAFASDLRRLRRDAGEPTYRAMGRIALFSPSVLSSAAGGHRLPTLQVTLAFVEACGGDRAEWEARWRALAGQAGVPGASAPATGVAAPGLFGPVAAARSVLPDRRVGRQREADRSIGLESHRTGGARVTAPIHPVAPGLPRPAQLPPGQPEFIGRRAELAEARSLIADGGVRLPLLVSGPIGVGKTAFALRLAHELAAQQFDAQLYADLGASPPAEVLTGFLRALGVSGEQIPAEPAQRAGLYRSLLAQYRVLVLLDDAHGEEQVRPLLAQTPRSVVLLTSRGRLLGLDGVRRVQLDAFDRDESQSMLAALGGRRRVQAEPDATAELAKFCDDLPLALSIVGRKIAAQPQWPVAHLLEWFAESDRLLGRLRVGDLSVRGRLQSAWDRLSPSARTLLYHLGRERPPAIGAPALAVMLGLTAESADELLEALLEAGLLRRAKVAGRYNLPLLVRLFASEQSDRGESVPHDQGSLSTKVIRPRSNSGTRCDGIDWRSCGGRGDFGIDCSVESIVPVNHLSPFDETRSARR